MEDADVAAAIRELAKQVDTLGNAVYAAAKLIAGAIRPDAPRTSGVSPEGTFT